MGKNPSIKDLIESTVKNALSTVKQAVGSQVSIIGSQTAPRRGTSSLIEAYNTTPWLRAVTKNIAQRFATTPWELWVRVDEQGRAVRRLDGLTKSIQRNPKKYLTRALVESGEYQRIEDHIFLDVLAKPNPRMMGSASMMLTQLYRDIVGESFWMLVENKAGVPVQFWPVPPHWVTGIPTVDRPYYDISIGSSGFMEKLPEDNVIWFRELNPADPYGRSTGTGISIGDELETDEYAAHFIKNFFLNRARPELLISVEGADEEGLRAAKNAFENAHLGYQRAHRSWWQNGRIDVKELTRNFGGMEFVDLRKYERDIFLQVYGVPPEQLGIVTNSNRATAHQSETTMAKGVLVPRLDAMREQLQYEILPKYDDRLILSYVSPVPEDIEFQLEVIRSASWAFERGEIRQMAGFESRGEGDEVHLQPLSLIEIPAPERSELRPTAAYGVKTKALSENGELYILDALEADRLSEAVVPLWQEETLRVGTAALENVGSAISFNMLNPFVVEHLENFATDRMKEINETTREALKKILSEGRAEGIGSDEMARRIKEVFREANTTRARRIARTETVRSQSFANIEAYKQSGVVREKMWIVTPDGKRHDSAGYGGTRAPLNEDFIFPDGSVAHAPGGFGEADQDINCRCDVAPITETFEEADIDEFYTRERMEAIWRANDTDRMKWERKAEAAFRRGFAQQEKDVLKAFDEQVI